MFVHLPMDAFEAITAGTPELARRNNHNVIGFDAAAIESLTISFRMPDDYDSGTNVTGTLTMFAATATSGNVRARLEFERVNTDIDADSFDTAVEVNATANGTSGIAFTAVFTLANGDLDACAAGDLMRVKVSRVGNDGTNDTMTGDAQFKDFVLSQ
jgi:hypothetical protein